MGFTVKHGKAGNTNVVFTSIRYHYMRVTECFRNFLRESFLQSL
jgi:hypothetical protein